MPVKAPAKFDAHQSYVVRSRDIGYKGISAKQEFLNGKAQLFSLPADASTEDVQERLRHLEWLDNAGYTIEKADFLQAREPEL